MKLRYIFLGLCVCLLCVWGGAVVRCEILTKMHYDEFKDAYKQNTMLGEMEFFKVLDCSEERARVYYVSEGKKSGTVSEFEYNSETGVWDYVSWGDGWSTSGNADRLVYPYWWHFVYFMKPL